MAATVEEHEQTLLEQVSPARLMADVQTIAQWERLSGSEEEAAAFDWLERELRGLGLEVRRYAHPALVSWPESAVLTLEASDGALFTVPCKTHAFAASTAPEGLRAPLVYVGRATPENLSAVNLQDKIALLDGIVAPNLNLLVERSGAAGSIWIAGSRLHERALSPVWGTPTPETATLLPSTPSVSVTGDVGETLRNAAANDALTATLQTTVYQAWRELPLLTAELWPTGDGVGDPSFVLFSGHVDSWYFGAMDNGSANATQLEVARVLAGRRADLRRGLRLAFWSGHSHARYAGSAWYADNCWQELHEHCVAHINVDSPGGVGATVLSEGNSMAELREFTSDAIEAVAGQRLSARRYGRSGDQSFWGHGIPAALMSLSEQPPENADPLLLALHHQISGGASAAGGLGWWWHTPDDLPDKLNAQFLERDARIYVLLLYRLCTAQVLPLDYRPTVVELKASIARLQADAGEHVDLAPVGEAVNALGAALEQLYAGPARQRNDGEAAVLNRALMAIGRALIPVDYTRAGEFGHDLAVPTEPLPGLADCRKLPGLAGDEDVYHFLRTRVMRERNRVTAGLIEARRAAEAGAPVSE
jgi:hypothetical protein